MQPWEETQISGFPSKGGAPPHTKKKMPPYEKGENFPQLTIATTEAAKKKKDQPPT